MKKIKKSKNSISSCLYVTPAMLLLLVFLLIPLFYSLYCGFYSYKFLNKGAFQGLKNYIYCLTDPVILNSFKTTLIVTLSSTLISLLLGLLLAVWIDKKQGLFSYMIEMIGLIP